MQSKLMTKPGGLLLLLLMAACGGGGDDDGGGPDTPVRTTGYSVEFSAVQVVGALAAPDTVTATASLSSRQADEITAIGSVTVSGITANSVTINEGYAGETGPVVVALSDGGGGTWNVPAGTDLDSSDLFRLDAAGYYVSIQSPTGELRGQILPQNWVAGIIELDAASVVPASTSAGTAKAGLSLNAVTGQYRIRITVSGVGDAVGAAMRNAIAGARGDVVISLEQSATDPNVWGSGDINNANISNRLTLTGLDLLGSGALYLSLESATNPDGALRGQIVDGSIDVFDIDLTTFEVVASGPPVTSDAEGIATVTWVEAASRFGIAVNTDITDAIAVYVNQGEAGQNGTLLFSLTQDVTVPGNWVLSPTDLGNDQATAFLEDEFYVSVVTGTYPEGELRGQLDPDASDMTSSKTVGENGGRLSVTDENGTSYALTVSPDGLFEETVEMRMSVMDAPMNLPAGLTPVAAVVLEPAGTTFAEFPLLEIDGALPSGAKIAFVANDDFSEIEFRPLRGDDPIAAALGTGSAAFDVPHFSVAGVAVVDAACQPPGPAIGNTPEEIATSAVTEHFAYIACNQLTGGQPSVVDTDYVGQQMRPWIDSLATRSQAASAQQLDTFGELLHEAVRYVILGQLGGLDVDGLENRATRNLFDIFGAQIRDSDTACLGGANDQTGEFLRWSGKVHRVYQGGRPNQWRRPILACLVEGLVTPEGPHAVDQDSTPIVFDPIVTGADGRDLTSLPMLSLGWNTTLGLSQTDGTSLEFDTSFVGLREARVVGSYFEFADPPFARKVVVYDHTGARQIDSLGTATGCDDPEDDGGRGYFIPSGFAITSQSTVANSDNSATVTIAGSGGSGPVTIDSLTISVTYDANTEASLSGTATGSLTFTETGVDEETGQPYTNRGSINLGSTAVSNDLFNFRNASGTDSFGCTLRGSVQLGGVLGT